MWDSFVNQPVVDVAELQRHNEQLLQLVVEAYELLDAGLHANDESTKEEYLEWERKIKAWLNKIKPEGT